ncbi:MAG: hypothetical protein ACLTWO_10010 [Blautia massiliensis (ex Durand et al. 2017)]
MPLLSLYPDFVKKATAFFDGKNALFVHGRGRKRQKRSFGEIVVNFGGFLPGVGRLCQFSGGGYPGCYGENFSTAGAKPGRKIVEKWMAMRLLNIFHRVFNMGKVENALQTV